MNDQLKSILSTVAPTVASAVLGPLGGAAVASIGKILGIDNATEDKIAQAVGGKQLTPDQVSELQKLEMQYQNDEKERGFKYAELAAKDRDSARQANVQGGTQKLLFYLSIVLLVVCLGSEVAVLFKGYPKETPDIVIGRILGLLDAAAMMVLNYWLGTSNSSQQKTEMLSKK